ncbi:MAG: tyrosine-protein phosphatase [Tannerellaceae bacterium]|jgi:protein tyrosine/serine phosphatase|nr:tyrosine-protein phosphatase [Tannerellaceae bacterium]
MTRYLFSLLILFATSVTIHGQGYWSESITLPGSTIRNFHQIDSGVYRSGQPDQVDFKALEAFGIQEVLNLRNFHNDKDEAEGTSLVLHHVRINAFSINKKQLIKAMRIIKDRKGPVLIHCLHGSDRTGAVIALYRMLFQQVPKEEAIREMKEGGFGHHSIFFNITRTLEKIDIDEVRNELGIGASAVNR